MGLSITEYARHRGVSHVAVLKAIKAGRITKGTDGTIDPALADASWQQKTHPVPRQPAPQSQSYASAPEHVVESPSANSGGPSYAQSRAIKEAYHARLAKLAYEEKSATLVRADKVKVSWFNALRVLRDRVLNLPDRLSPLLAAEIDPKIIHDLLDSELRQILNDAADTVANQGDTP
jgi:hypothetical protein